MSVKCASEPLRDSFYVVHVLFFLMGLSHNIPMTFFTNASGYWMFKFRNTTTNLTSAEDRTELQTYFASIATIATTVPLVVFMLLTTIYGDLVRCALRIKTTCIIMIVLFIIATGFIKINTDSWQSEFFILSMSIISLINAANACFGVTTLAIVSKFPKELLNCFLTGQAIAGVFISSLQILSLLSGTSATNSAVIYFITGCCILMLTLVFYMLSSQSSYYQSYIKKEDYKKHTVGLREFRDTFKLVWTSVLVFFFASLTTACTYPSITNLVVSEHSNTWGNIYFVPVCAYLVNNVSDLIGRSVTPLLGFQVDGKILAVFSIIRMIGLVPLVVLCNAQPRSHLPVVFTHDYQFAIIVMMYGFSRGYFYIRSFINVQRLAEPEKLEISLSVLMTFTGIMSGLTSPLSFLSVKIL